MQIHHRLVFNANRNGTELELLDDKNIPYHFHSTGAYPNAEDAVGLITLEIAESHPSWEFVDRLAKRMDCVDQVKTEFTTSEYGIATLFEVMINWHHGYPMPDLDNGYMDITYETKGGCRRCGMGWQQIAPFRMKGEPKWGKKQVMQLNWVFDEYFVTPGAYEFVFKPFGIASKEVLHHKTGNQLENVVQLVIDGVSDYPLDISKPPDEVCGECGRGKFHAHVRGFFPRILGEVDKPIFKTQEYFGSGGSAWNAVILSKELYRAISDNKLKGVGFYPLAD